ncbi:unnamed protein product [Phaedon cochleariae]|uniref:C2H2-type domain-containing protein n=1 Tax=Phaedon cochleariae TaxID=80249 RepID=A0A9N9S9R9_PHACE|nr:unnamed protein product [Phaedon cochleariae]
MENTDSYLHKKFKKQLSVTPKVQNDKENKSAPRTEQSEEKTLETTAPSQETSSDTRIVYHQTPSEYNQTVENQILDNNIVPNQSTKSSTVNSNFSKSSISIEIQQSSNSYISHVVSNQSQHLTASFDTKFREQTNHTVSPSSILDSYYSRQGYANEDMYLNYNNQEEYPDLEAPPPPDKNPNGKYVCPYCSLVCSKPSVLQKHIRAHTNERPFPCTSCGFSFKTRSNLYKHCRSRTHANRVMGTKNQEAGIESDCQRNDSYVANSSESNEDPASMQKPYKPRFHTSEQLYDNLAKENIEEDRHNQDTSSDLSYHINEIINKNNSIVNPNGTFQQNRLEPVYVEQQRTSEEPLNLTNKNRKRSLSEVTEPVVPKSLIKELLLKNLSASDMQCPHCKMLFQTVTELDVHKYRGNCKGKSLGAKYTRSSSVNVASILTQNKNAFDNIPQLQNTVFPLNSPGPFLGKTRLVDGDKSKSFSFDGGHLPLLSPNEPSPNYLLSPLPFDREKKPGHKLFGGEVKVQGVGESKSFSLDSKDEKYEPEPRYNVEYANKLSENRVVKSCLLQSGGTVLTNKTNYNKQNLKNQQEVIRVFETSSASPSIDICSFGRKFTFDGPIQMQERREESEPRLGESSKTYPDQPSPLYKNMMDFSQTVLRKLTPNLRQPNFALSNVPAPRNTLINPLEKAATKLAIPTPRPNLEITLTPLPDPESKKNYYEASPLALYNPVNLLVNGKVVRHVPGMPGPVVAPDSSDNSNIVAVVKPMQPTLPPLPPLMLDSCGDETPVRRKVFLQPEKLPDRPAKSPNLKVQTPEAKPELPSKPPEQKPKPAETKPPDVEMRKFARPSSLALKPTVASLKQHHGLTPTMFNQILISPDTPRVAKKYAEHLIQGNYFSYLGLKSSTKPVYCTLNKTQPFYVPHFKKLSMYSEWRQQDTRQDKLYVSNYDSRQKSGRYSVAGRTKADLMTHSSYKFMVSESSHNSEKDDEPQKNSGLPGGYESNEDYTYIRGRGRGRYVCDQCGIRCKKPSMLKKHIRTHSNDRPYTCSHCNFSFKTKGNLTKHMKSKAHSKNSTASSGSSSSTQLSAHSSDSDTDDSGMDSSDESTRQQEHEAAYGLLSLSQKPSGSSDLAHLRSCSPGELFMSTEEIEHVSQTNYARNKCLDERNRCSDERNRCLDERNRCLDVRNKCREGFDSKLVEGVAERRVDERRLGTASGRRPLTYPYTRTSEVSPDDGQLSSSPKLENVPASPEPKSIKQFHVIQKYMPQLAAKLPEKLTKSPEKQANQVGVIQPLPEAVVLNNKRNLGPCVAKALPILKINDVVVGTEGAGDLRKRKCPPAPEVGYKNKIQKNDEVMDLSMTTVQEKTVNGADDKRIPAPKNVANEIYNVLQKPEPIVEAEEEKPPTQPQPINGAVLILRPLPAEDQPSDEQDKAGEYDNSAMETLADIATKQVKLEKNTLAKSVATEFLKLATQNEHPDGGRDASSYGKDVNDLIAKSEGNKSCTICAKSFNKPSQLRLHMNIHYLERPFRCESCSVSFRTKGHLQKHERSAGHNNKLSSSPTLSSSEPRPFKCTDCSIAFRIHGHLAKHLRSKLHIMKLECLAKIPFGLYAELERSNSLLTEINTSDGDQCLESLKILAKKVFINDPSKLNHVEIRENINAE